MPDPFTKPFVPRPLRCRFGWHRWKGMATARAPVSFMSRPQRGCARCGKVELCGAGIGWGHWGYLRPADLGMEWRAMIDKYVGPDKA